MGLLAQFAERADLRFQLGHAVAVAGQRAVRAEQHGLHHRDADAVQRVDARDDYLGVARQAVAEGLGDAGELAAHRARALAAPGCGYVCVEAW